MNWDFKCGFTKHETLASLTDLHGIVLRECTTERTLRKKLASEGVKEQQGQLGDWNFMTLSHNFNLTWAKKNYLTKQFFHFHSSNW